MATLAIAATGVSMTFLGQAVPEITNITDIGGTSTVIDVTAHDSASAWGSSIPTFLSGGTVRVTMNYVPGNAVHHSFWTQMLLRTSGAVTVVLPDTGAATWSFSAFVTRFRIPTMPVNGVLPLEVELTVDGAVTLTQ